MNNKELQEIKRDYYRYLEKHPHADSIDVSCKDYEILISAYEEQAKENELLKKDHYKLSKLAEKRYWENEQLRNQLHEVVQKMEVWIDRLYITNGGINYELHKDMYSYIAFLQTKGYGVSNIQGKENG